MQETSKAKILFAEILNGYSKVDYKGQSLYIKHFDNFVVADASIEYQKAVEYAKSRHVLTQAERLQELIEQKLWSPDREKEIDKFSLIISSFIQTGISVQTLLWEECRICLFLQERLNTFIPNRSGTFRI